MPHPSIDSAFDTLQLIAPNSSFLALGQTVFWDEPVKAVWRRILDQRWPAAQLIAGIHDTDYFAKTTAHVADDQEFIALAHDDGSTRGLWSAAGELSSLLGSEDLPTRSFYESLGIPFDDLTGQNAATRRTFFNEYTSAYGWRGIVQTTGSAQISHDVPLKNYGMALVGLLDWGFRESLCCLDRKSAEAGAKVAEKIKDWVVSFLESCSEHCTLTDLYQYLLPKFYELLLDFEPSNFSVTSTTALLVFNRQTCHLPRFSVVGHFLNPATRQLASSAYSNAVVGGGMYSLEHFGENALPFDIVVPGVGRGTLHINSENITIDFSPTPIVIPTESPVIDLVSLATVVNRHFGDQVVLVGKAVSLISMLAAEFIVVFHETASGYTDRTAAMNNELRTHGITLDLKPIVRLQYNTWDSLSNIDGPEFFLPDHLATSFHTIGQPVPVSAFAKDWRNVVEQQKHKIDGLKNVRRLRDLLIHLHAATGSDDWRHRSKQLEAAIAVIKENFESTRDLRMAIKEVTTSLHEIVKLRLTTEKQSGVDYHVRLRPLQLAALNGDESVKPLLAEIEADRQTRFHETIRVYAEAIRAIKKRRREMITMKRLYERSPEIVRTRGQIAEINREANLAKLNAARSAYLTVHGLPHTNSRPTAWWLPMVDPTGTWFDNITESVQARLEVI